MQFAASSIMDNDIYLYDEEYRRDGFSPLAGLDEAGRGPLAGPVVAAAVVLPSSVTIKGLKDSKKVRARLRESLFWEILTLAEDFGIGIVGSKEIDRINIYQAARKAMTLAVNDLSNPPGLLVIDAMTLPLSVKQISITRAESVSASVAAASIMAKVTRDRLMEGYHSIYPLYDFAAHRGYGTKKHLEMLETHGPCDIHRRSFEPVSRLKLPF